MTEIIIIVAIGDNYGIGKDGKIPWYISEDFKYFKNKTIGHPCIMGDVTYESLPKKPFEGRENIICAFKENYKPEGTVVFNDFFKAIEYVKQNNEEKAFICGGATIYKIGMKVADTLLITRVHMSPESDTFFPEISEDEWELVNEDPRDGYTFQTYKRRKLEE